MREGLRIIRLALWIVALVVAGVSVLSYVLYAANGIWDKTQEQARRNDHDRVIVLTATALSVRLTELARPTDTVTPTSTATLVFTSVPTETPLPTNTVTLSPTPSNTPTSTATATETLMPSITPIPTNTPHLGLTPSPPVGILNTLVPTPAGN